MRSISQDRLKTIERNERIDQRSLAESRALLEEAHATERAAFAELEQLQRDQNAARESLEQQVAQLEREYEGSLAQRDLAREMSWQLDALVRGESDKIPAALAKESPELVGRLEQLRAARRELEEKESSLAKLQEMERAASDAIEAHPEAERLFSLLESDPELAALFDRATQNDAEAIREIRERNPEAYAITAPVLEFAEANGATLESGRGELRALAAAVSALEDSAREPLQGLFDPDRQPSSTELGALGIEAAELRRQLSEMDAQHESTLGTRLGEHEALAQEVARLETVVQGHEKSLADAAIEREQILAREADYEASLQELAQGGDLQTALLESPYTPEGEVSVRYQAAVDFMLRDLAGKARRQGNEPKGYADVVAGAEPGTLWRGHNAPSSDISPKAVAMGGAQVSPRGSYAVGYVTNQGASHPFMPEGVGFVTKYRLRDPSQPVRAADEWLEKRAQEQMLPDDPALWPKEILATAENSEIEGMYLVTGGVRSREDETRGEMQNISALRHAPELVLLQQKMNQDLVARSLAAAEGRVPSATDWHQAAEVLAGRAEVSANALSKVLWDSRNLSMPEHMKGVFAKRLVAGMQRAQNPAVRTLDDMREHVLHTPPVTEVAPDGLGHEDGVLEHWLKPSTSGSNDGQWFQGRDGAARYVKEYGDPAQAWNEHVANRVYRELNIPVGPTELLRNSGGVLLASREVPGAKPGGEIEWTPEKAREFLGGHVADVLLRNWDVTGKGYGNLLHGEDGRVVRIDHGGALLYRAQAARGRKDLDSTTLDSVGVEEMQTMLDPTRNAEYAKIYAAAGYSANEWDQEVARQIQDAQGVLTPERLAEIVGTERPGEVAAEDVAATQAIVENRLAAMQQWALSKGLVGAPEAETAQPSAPAPAEDSLMDSLDDYLLDTRERMLRSPAFSEPEPAAQEAPSEEATRKRRLR